MLLAVLLAGCSDTTVYIPEDADWTEEGIVVYIPADPEKTAEEETVPETAVPTEPAETEPEQKNSDTVSKKGTTSSNKGTSTGNKTENTNKDTITGSAEPTETQPSATEAPEATAGSETITVTEPPSTEPPVTEPPATEPPVTEPPATELPTTEPPGTEPPVTEPPATEPLLYDISGYAVGDLEYAVLDRINEYRLDAGLEELWMDEYLCAIASCRSYESSLVWSHTRPDGRNCGTVLADYGYGGSVAGELLGYSTGDGGAEADKWLQSESHRALLMGSSSVVGIGIYCSGGVIYVACLLVG